MFLLTLENFDGLAALSHPTDLRAACEPLHRPGRDSAATRKTYPRRNEQKPGGWANDSVDAVSLAVQFARGSLATSCFSGQM